MWLSYQNAISTPFQKEKNHLPTARPLKSTLAGRRIPATQLAFVLNLSQSVFASNGSTMATLTPATLKYGAATGQYIHRRDRAQFPIPGRLNLLLVAVQVKSHH